MHRWGTHIVIFNFIPRNSNYAEQVKLAEHLNSTKNELHHIHNSQLRTEENSDSINEFALLTFLDELSATVVGKLHDQELSGENIFNVIMSSFVEAASDHYMKEGFPKKIEAFIKTMPGKNKDISSIKINSARVKEIMNFYFTTKNIPLLSKLDKGQLLRFDNRLLKIKGLD